MYYRHKVLLSLIKTFGGALPRTDCQKLVFLFCQRTEKNYYDFFPYQYGGFSYVLNFDKRHLSTLGYLKNEEFFKLNSQSIPKIKASEQNALLRLKEEIGSLRGKALIRKAYREFPYFASNSLKKSEIFTSKELKQFKEDWKKEIGPCLYTLGYEGISIDGYLNKLNYHNIKILFDVRKNPISRKFGFSISKLKPYVEKLGIEYIHIPELGIASDLRKQLDSQSSYKKLFNLYQNDILPRQEQALKLIKSTVSNHGIGALTCFETDYKFCHRNKITEFLKKDTSFSTPVIHLN